MKIDREKIRLFLKFSKYLFPYYKRHILILVLSAISVFLVLLIPYISKLIVDSVVDKKNLQTFIYFGLLGTGAYILNAFCNSLLGFLRNNIRLKLNFDINRDIFKHLETLPYSYFQEKTSGEFLFKVNFDIENVVNLIVSLPEEIVKILPRIFLTLGIICYMNWQMAIFSLALIPFVYLPMLFFIKKMKALKKDIIIDSERIYERLEELFAHIYLIKAFGKEKKETNKYLKALIINTKKRIKNMRLGVTVEFLSEALNRIIVGVIALFGGFLIIKGKITPGSFVAILMYFSQLIGINRGIEFFIKKIIFGNISCKRLNKILEEPKTDNSFGKPKNISQISGANKSIIFKNVTFGYTPGKIILDKINLSFSKGFNAIAGASGCGKTTIINLILGLYKPVGGGVYIGETNLNEVNLSSFRKSVGICLQESFLWNDSIKNNIWYGNDKAQEEAVVEAASLSGVDAFAKNMPKGYDTVIGENASKISEGQKQKIAIARALIKKPDVLILDEAMSSMDSESEEKILDNIKELYNNKILIVISHRFSTVISSDLVYLFSKPNEIIISSPNEMMNNKIFTDLFF